MHRRLVITLLISLTCTLYAQQVSEVSFHLDNRELTIDYTLDKPAAIRVRLSVDRGRTFGAPLDNLSGDVGKTVQPGRRRIIAYDLRDLRGIDTGLVAFRVEIDDGSIEVCVADTVCFRMIPVAGGTFRMGCVRPSNRYNYDSELPLHDVTLSDYYIGQYEVTQGLWTAVMGENPSYWTGHDSLPVEQVSWNDVQLFIARLSQITGLHFRLPTEAEWEYAARGGNKSQGFAFPGTDQMPLDYAWFGSNAQGHTHPVGRKLPNELGLYDMAGNVWEWCSDWMGQYKSQPQTDPRGPLHGENRILRGGSINSPSFGCRVSDRSWYLPVNGYRYYGFRLVLEPEE
ncbi:MAG: sulfatase-modifying factor protein [bacterium P3]|nr:MAG: sulfatase-modifying factor protein [bacterium P3]KWW42199.1 MAG: sulfatase-modifying factor protein [bacterium F083]